MKALTLTQPWATLIAVGAKRIETRSWETLYRGPLAIHAGAGLGPVGGRRGLHSLAHSPPFFGALQKAMMRVRQSRDGETWPEFDAGLLPLGAIVAVAQLTEVALITDDGVLTQAGRLYPETPEHDFGDYTPGRFAWLLADVRRLDQPVPCKGALSLWALPPAVLAAVEAQL